MQRSFTILFVIFFTIPLLTQKCLINKVFEKKYSISLISQGDNRPDFSPRKDSVNLLLISLHNGFSIKDFKNQVKYSDQKVDEIIKFLISKNWAHIVNGKIKPSVFIATAEDGKKLYKYAEPISKEIAKVIKKQLPYIKTRFNETDISKKQSFNEWSFFILSNVLLDDYQIFNVENKFLGLYARPIRHGKNYYASIQEETGERESFNIYGNQFGKISVYGNNRSVADLKQTKFLRNNKDNGIFFEISKEFLPKLIDILSRHKKYSLEVYKKLGYSKEITFEEFYMWWYHFIYTQATDRMIESKIMYIPDDGNFIYEIELQ